jgi:hypothetical protein
VGFSGLLVSGTVVATSHHEPSPAGEGRVRYYLDRVDAADPANPELLPSVNIPGSLVTYDAASQHAVTADYQRVSIPELTARLCYERYAANWLPPNSGAVDYETTVGTCVVTQQILRLVAIQGEQARILDSYTLPLGELVTTTALGDDRLFISVGRPNYFYGIGVGVSDVGFSSPSFQSDTTPLIVLSGIRSGSWGIARLELPAGDNWGYVPLVASGHSAAISTGFRGKLAVVDASDPLQPRLVREVELSGYVQDLDVIGNTAVASLGYDGVQAISLAP